MRPGCVVLAAMDGRVRLGGNALLVAAVVGAAAVAAPDTGAATSAQAAFAVSVVQDDVARIYLIAADGTSRRRLRSGVGFGADRSEAPTWSPDGSRLVFAASRYPQDTTSIRIINADGTGERQLTPASQYAGSPRFSPDGGRIAFFRASTPDDDSFFGSIMVMRADGTAVSRLTRGAFDVGPVWSPEGSKLAFTRLTFRRLEPRSAVWVMNSDGSGQRMLVRDASSPAWSPDGQRLAFVRDAGGRRKCNEDDDESDCPAHGDIYVMRSDGSGETRVTRNSADDELPTWSPDGTQIAFSSNRSYQRSGEAFELYVADANGGCVRRITNTAAANYGASWRPSSGNVSSADCGGTIPAARTPIVEPDLGVARTFARFPLFYLGPIHRGALLTGTSGDDEEFSFSYDDCGRIIPSTCRDPIEVQVESVCQRGPLFFEPEFSEEKRLPGIGTRRGALVMRLRAGLVEVYTGSVLITLDGNARDMRRAIEALRPVKGPTGTGLRRPTLSRQVVRALSETVRVHRETGSIAAVQHRLGISRTSVRFRLKFARVLRRLGPVRASTC